MLGFTRPTNPVCPTAFPIDFRELQQKRARIREIERVYRAYRLE